MMMKMCSSNTIKSLKVVVEEDVAALVAAPPTPPQLRPAKKSVGIIAILGSDSERSKPGSIRRTLSADMSSKKWLSQNGFASPPTMKKTASSDELAAAPPAPEEEDEEDEIKSLDVWSSILQSNKTGDSLSQLPPPYVHPLVKKSANSLTGKSLEICTESLGSETGSDCFSSYPSSESGDSADEEKDDRQSPFIFPPFPEEFRAVKISYGKKSPPRRSFPPPLPSLVRGDDKPSVRMHSRRQHGRLILQAVSVPAQNCFRAERQDGRLILTFVETEGRDADKVLDEMPDSENNNPTIDGYEEEEEEEEEEKEMEIMIGKTSKFLIDVNSFIALNNNHKNNLNRSALIEEVEDDDQTTPLPHSLAPPLFQAAPPPTAASFNPYDFFWKKNPTTIATLVHIPSITDQHQYRNKVVTKCPKTSACEGKDHSLVLITGKHPSNNNNNNLILPMKNMRGCKEPRMSLLFWDSYCIATS